MQLTGKMVADSVEKTSAGPEPAAQNPEPVIVSFSSYEISTCQSELAVCKNSVSELSGIIIDKCEKPHHDFELTAWEVARAYTYSEDAFNCADFSEALAGRLKELGYKARVAHGYYKGEPHEWVVAEIPIEATSGNLIMPQYYTDYAEKG